MIGPVLKVLACFATTAVAVPYTTALLCNLAYGWPQIRHKYRRAFNPRKVYALNLAAIQQLILVVRFLPLYLQFRAFYKSASSSVILKDKTFGRNNQKLDLYFPKQRSNGAGKSHPVVMFVYGGAWSSGSKKMYGMVCSAIAQKLDAIVCCPDYSRYPLGHVDNMVEDMIDCATWLYRNVEFYRGDKSNIMLLGHSSGAHLCFMSVYEFFIRHNTVSGLTRTLPEFIPSISTHVSGKQLEFKAKHFSESLSASSQNICLEATETSESFYLVKEVDKNDGPDISEGSLMENDLQELLNTSDSNLRHRGSPSMSNSGSEMLLEINKKRRKNGSGEFVDVQEEYNEGEDSEDNDSVITVVKPDDFTEAEQMILHEEELSYADVSKSIKAVIGLAGVYDIGDHFQHEMKRGIEDLSCMTRAMYGPQRFDRFSPTYLYGTITKPPRLPKFVLLHGTDDHVVPLTSTTKFGEVVQKYHPDCVVRIIPNCDHYEICLDLNKSSRKFHETVMAVIEDTAKNVFTK